MIGSRRKAVKSDRRTFFLRRLSRHIAVRPRHYAPPHPTSALPSCASAPFHATPCQPVVAAGRPRRNSAPPPLSPLLAAPLAGNFASNNSAKTCHDLQIFSSSIQIERERHLATFSLSEMSFIFSLVFYMNSIVIS